MQETARPSAMERETGGGHCLEPSAWRPGHGAQDQGAPQVFAATLGKPYVFEHEPFVLQSEAQSQEDQDCSEDPV